MARRHTSSGRVSCHSREWPSRVAPRNRRAPRVAHARAERQLTDGRGGVVRPDGKDITDGPASSPEIAAALMNEDEVVRIVRSYLEGVFPKVCGRCGQRFDSLREYLEATTHLSTPVLYDDIDGD